MSFLRTTTSLFLGFEAPLGLTGSLPSQVEEFHGYDSTARGKLRVTGVLTGFLSLCPLSFGGA